MARHRTPKAAKAEATRLHSLLVRSRGACEHCAKATDLQCAHIISRRYSATRTRLDNAFCLCAGCHLRFTEWPLEFARFVEERIGADKYAELVEASQSRVKVDWFAEVDRLRGLIEEAA